MISRKSLHFSNKLVVKMKGFALDADCATQKMKVSDALPRAPTIIKISSYCVQPLFKQWRTLNLQGSYLAPIYPEFYIAKQN